MATAAATRVRPTSPACSAVPWTADYTIPAFIPGLKYEGNYKLSCQGASFQPALTQPDLFIARRGAIIRLDIPCRKVVGGEIPPLLQDPPKTN